MSLFVPKTASGGVISISLVKSAPLISYSASLICKIKYKSPFCPYLLALPSPFKRIFIPSATSLGSLTFTVFGVDRIPVPPQ